MKLRVELLHCLVASLWPNAGKIIVGDVACVFFRVASALSFCCYLLLSPIAFFGLCVYVFSPVPFM